MLPITVVALIAVTDWRNVWLAGALLLVASIPLVRWLVAARSGDSGAETPSNRIATGLDHTLAQVLREPRFWLRAPAILAPSFIYTGLILHQVALAETKGWPLTLWASSYLVFAGFSVMTVIPAGMLVDRVSARRILPFPLAPLALSCLALWNGEAASTAFVFMALMGINAGVTQAIFGTIWSELYGVRHIGRDSGLRLFSHGAFIRACAGNHGERHGWRRDDRDDRVALGLLLHRRLGRRDVCTGTAPGAAGRTLTVRCLTLTSR